MNKRYKIKYGLRKSDVDQYVQFWNESYHDVVDWQVTKKQVEANRTRRDIGPKQGHVLVLDDGRIIAECVVYPGSKKLPDSARLTITIHPSRFSKDLFNELLEMGLKEAKQQGIKSITTITAACHTKIIKYLEEAGFKEKDRGFKMVAVIGNKERTIKFKKGYSIRRFSYPDDVENYADAVKRGNPNMPPASPGLIKKFFDEGLLSSSDVFVAEHDGKIIGGVIGSPEKVGDRMEGNIHGFGVIPEEQNTGIKIALLDTALNHFIISGIKTASFGSIDTPNSLKKLENLGFKKDRVIVIHRKVL